MGQSNEIFTFLSLQPYLDPNKHTQSRFKVLTNNYLYLESRKIGSPLSFTAGSLYFLSMFLTLLKVSW
jgi:hypothetical protein